MSHVNEYFLFCLGLATRKQDPQKNEAHYIVPASSGGERKAENRIFLTPYERVSAWSLLLKFADDDRSRRAAAAGLLHAMNRRSGSARTAAQVSSFERDFSADRATAESIFYGASHYNADEKEYTIWRFDGSHRTGTKVELARLTGLHPNRIYDLTSGRRSYANGWFRSKDDMEDNGGQVRKKGRPKNPVSGRDRDAVFDQICEAAEMLS